MELEEYIIPLLEASSEFFQAFYFLHVPGVEFQHKMELVDLKFVSLNLKGFYDFVKNDNFKTKHNFKEDTYLSLLETAHRIDLALEELFDWYDHNYDKYDLVYKKMEPLRQACLPIFPLLGIGPLEYEKMEIEYIAEEFGSEFFIIFQALEVQIVLRWLRENGFYRKAASLQRLLRIHFRPRLLLQTTEAEGEYKRHTGKLKISDYHVHKSWLWWQLVRPVLLAASEKEQALFFPLAFSDSCFCPPQKYFELFRIYWPIEWHNNPRVEILTYGDADSAIIKCFGEHFYGAIVNFQTEVAKLRPQGIDDPANDSVMFLAFEPIRKLGRDTARLIDFDFEAHADSLLEEQLIMPEEEALWENKKKLLQSFSCQAPSKNDL